MPEGTNVLLGRVVEIGTNAPVGRAIVTLVGHFDASGRPAEPSALSAVGRSAPPPSVSVMTTATGEFVVGGLPAGLFTASVRALGYLSNEAPQTVVEVRDSRRPTEVRLRVWKSGSLAGRVVDDRGEPLTGLVVSALQRMPSASGPLLQRVASAATDDRGEYRLSPLTPGEYVVGAQSAPTTLPVGVAAALDPSVDNRDVNRAMVIELIQSGYGRTYGCDTCISGSHEGYHVAGVVLQRPGATLPPAPDGRPLGFESTYYPGTTRAEDAAVIALGSDSTRTNLDFAVRLVPTVVVNGTAAGPDGPLPHVALSLIPPGTGTSAFDPPVATAVSDTSGAFAFLGITPGTYTLKASRAIVTNEEAGEGSELWAEQPVSVEAEGATDVVVTFRPGIPISGHVEFTGATSDEDRPSQRHVINLQPIGATSWRTVPTVVQPDGTFRSSGDPPGHYIFNASSPPGWYLQTVTLNGRPLLDGMLDLGTTEASGLSLTYGRTTNRVSGQVSGDDLTAVVVFPADSDAWRQGVQPVRRMRRTYATSTGAFEVKTLDPGEYYVAAVNAASAWNWQDPAWLARLIPSATRVTLGVSDEKTVSLRPIPVTEH